MNTIIIVLLAIGILGFVWSRLRNNPKVQKFIKTHIIDSHDNYHDPRCFDCNRGSCIEPTVCEIITNDAFEMEGGSPDGR